MPLRSAKIVSQYVFTDSLAKNTSKMAKNLMFLTWNCEIVLKLSRNHFKLVIKFSICRQSVVINSNLDWRQFHQHLLSWHHPLAGSHQSSLNNKSWPDTGKGRQWSDSDPYPNEWKNTLLTLYSKGFLPTDHPDQIQGKAKAFLRWVLADRVPIWLWKSNNWVGEPF